MSDVKHTPDLCLPWSWRSMKYDDWGTIRDSTGSPVLDGCRIAQYTDTEADEARQTRTVPAKVEAICRYTVRAVNAHDDLLEALKGIIAIADDMGGKTPAQRCAMISNAARAAITRATRAGGE